MQNLSKSQKIWYQLQKLIPGGVNSPVRACRSVNMDPLILRLGQGAYVETVDGERYLDYVGSWGPLILGHAHPEVIEVVGKVLRNGLSFGAPCELEEKLASLIIEAIPSIQMIRMVNSGTEAVMSAIRLARGYTRRNKILKFEGCYHGHADHLLAQAGSGLATLQVQAASGVPDSFIAHTITVPYNNVVALTEIFERWGQDIAAVILEPVAANMGVVFAKKDFLESIKHLTKKNNSLLICDEVITGFRLSYGGVQEQLDLKPDLTILGKIIGGGMPVGAFGGRREIMQYLAPLGPVYQAGTLSGNPVAMAAGTATLEILKKSNPYWELDRKGHSLKEGIDKVFRQYGIDHVHHQIGSLGSIFFSKGPIENYQQVEKSNVQAFQKFYQLLRQRKINIAPSAYEAYFISTAHTYEDIEQTIQTVAEIAQNLF